MAEDDKYVNSFTMKEMNFDDGNSIIAVDINVEEFIAMLKNIETNDKGYAKFRIVRRKSVSEWGHTHFMSKFIKKADSESSGESKKDTGAKKSKSGTAKPKRKEKDDLSGGDDDMPF